MDGKRRGKFERAEEWRRGEGKGEEWEGGSEWRNYKSETEIHFLHDRNINKFMYMTYCNRLYWQSF